MSWARPLRRLEVLIARKNNLEDYQVITSCCNYAFCKFHFVELFLHYMQEKLNMKFRVLLVGSNRQEYLNLNILGPSYRKEI